MEKEKLYHIALDDYEHGVVIRSLNDEKTKLMEEGKYSGMFNDRERETKVLNSFNKSTNKYKLLS